MTRNAPKDAISTAATITLTYLAVGAVWVMGTGLLLRRWVPNPELATLVEIAKGLLFILFTGGIVFLLTQRAIAARIQVENALRESETRLRRVVESSIVGVIFWGADGGVFDANDAFLRLLGLNRAEVDFSRLNWRDLTPGEYLDADDRAVAETRTLGACRAYEKQFFHQDGHRVDVLILGAALEDTQGTGVAFVLDLSERKLLERQLIQSQKMEGLGRLAGSVAHDFNNLLTAILGYTELAQRGLPPDHPAGEALANVRKAGERAADLTRQLLVFARKQAVERTAVDLRLLLGEVQGMLSHLLGEGMRLEVAPGPAAVVEADPGQLTQVLINLTVNARDAMPEGGTVTIRLRTETLAQPTTGVPGGALPAGEYVVLEVSDTGTGITEQNQRRLFEPFFTTKEPGKGTGLGLATCYGIVRQFGGSIRVKSALEAGTTFAVFLPSSHAAPHNPPPAAPQAHGGHERVLLVEDDEVVRTMAAITLRARGYTVVEAADGLEALDLARQSPVDVVLTDLVMPRMDGAALAQALEGTVAASRIVFMSGYSDIPPEKMPPHSPANFLHKPFTPDTLAQRVRQVLGEG